MRVEKVTLIRDSLMRVGSCSWELGGAAGSWEPRSGSWELQLGAGTKGDLGRLGFSGFPEVVGDLDRTIKGD